jgi:hypothetical protein
MREEYRRKICGRQPGVQLNAARAVEGCLVGWTLAVLLFGLVAGVGTARVWGWR